MQTSKDLLAELLLPCRLHRKDNVTQGDPLVIHEVLFQTGNSVEVVIKETRSLAQHMVDFVLVVVRETISLRNVTFRKYQVQEIPFLLNPRYKQ